MSDMGMRRRTQAYETAEQIKAYPILCLSLDRFPGLDKLGKEATLLVKVRVVGVKADHDGDHVELEVLQAKAAPGKSMSSADRSMESLTGGYR